MKFRLPRVYPITDQQLSGLSHADQVVLLAGAGAKLIQLRDKESSARQFFREAEKALRVARELRVRIIINDRVDIALAVEADGVHLGQDDMPPVAARRILGERAIIGLSTHNPDQAREATGEPIDYMAAGPIFDTDTKTNPDAAIGVAGLREVRELIGEKPLVAIGGIREANAAEVFRAGADSVAMIGGLVRNPNQIPHKMKALLSIS